MNINEAIQSNIAASGIYELRSSSFEVTCVLAMNNHRYVSPKLGDVEVWSCELSPQDTKSVDVKIWGRYCDTLSL